MGDGSCPNCSKPYQSSDEVCRYCGFILPFSTSVLTPGKLLRQRYEIQGLAHSGGMGYVYLAKDKNLYDRLCVVKQVKEPVKSDTDRKRLEEEALRMSKLSHSNAAMILDQFVEGGYYFLVVQHISGKTLGQVLEDRRGPLTEEEVVNWAISMCDVVSYLHSKGVIHRDISPENIMLTDEGGIMFIDFGTMRELRQITSEKTAGIGKFGFTPPEQWQGRPVAQSDTFAIGATVYYLLTEYLPLSTEYQRGQKPQPTDFRPSFPPIREKNPDVSGELEAVLQEALQLDVSERYSSAQQLGQVFREVQAQPAAPAQGRERVGHGPRLSVDRIRIDFGSVIPGSRPSRSFAIRNTGGGVLMGKITASEPWLEVSSTIVDGMDCQATGQWILVTVDGTRLPLNFRGSGHIDIETNGGREQIEVTVTTVLGKKARRKWLVIVGGVVGAFALFMVMSAECPSAAPSGDSHEPLPVLSIDPNYVFFDDLEPGTGSYYKSFTVSNAGAGTITGTLSSMEDWLHVDPTEIQVTDSEQEVKVRVDTTGLSYAFRDTGYVKVTTNCGDAEITVTLQTIAKTTSTASGIIFEDDFSDPSSGWYEGSWNRGEWSYKNGGYRILAREDEQFGMYGIGNANIGQLDDFVLEVDGKSLSSAKGSAYGVYFRQEDSDNYYYFEISSGDGRYAVGKLSDGDWSILKDWGYSSHIQTHTSTNRLKVVCQGVQISLYINGHHLDTVTDVSFPKGDIGLAVWPEADVLFDNLKIYAPD